ncbi:RES family NAD+ phosphorylase [Allohahella marinimesophila]|uniref:RES family NAD+ phosphorylase n=1 Tax=Allohahella marinimesophila TaxID=1054972 RepID=A0ABP7Q3M8_9GAMM
MTNNAADIWDSSQGARQIRPLNGKLYRLVESQEQIATLGYVDTLEEQALLEELLETAKPAHRFAEVEEQAEDPGSLHYLLLTPFRYPPLKWGSRFGRTHEQGIFYGGGDIDVTLAESAYYRFVFWFSMSAAPIKDSIRTSHTLFSAPYSTQRGVQIQRPPFDEYMTALTHPSNYSQTQTLGSQMREAGVEAFEYCSARDPSHGLCVALFTPAAFECRKPDSMQQWFCEVSAYAVSFKQLAEREVIHFQLEDFLVDGTLPLPA